MGRSHTLRVYRLQLSAHFGLAFAAASRLRRLTLLQTSNSPDHYAKGTPSAACGASSALSLRPLVGTRFQVLFHSPPGVLFTFPSRYWFTIGRQLVFRLMRWSAQIHTKFHVRRITQEIPRRARVFGYGPFTLSGAAFQKLHLTFALPHRAPTTPQHFQSTLVSMESFRDVPSP